VEARFGGTAGRRRRFAVWRRDRDRPGLGWSLPAGVIGPVRRVFGLAVRVHVWLDTPLDATVVASRDRARRDRAATLLFTASFMVSLGLFFALALTLTRTDRHRDSSNGRYDLELGLAGGVAGGLLGRFFVRTRAPSPTGSPAR